MGNFFCHCLWHTTRLNNAGHLFMIIQTFACISVSTFTVGKFNVVCFRATEPSSYLSLIAGFKVTAVLPTRSCACRTRIYESSQGSLDRCTHFPISPSQTILYVSISAYWNLLVFKLNLFIEELWCSGLCIGYWECNDEQDKQDPYSQSLYSIQLTNQ